MQIELKRQGDLGLGGSTVVLCHGMNDVPEEAWERVADDEITQWYVNEGLVVIHEAAAAEVAQAESNAAPATESNREEPPADSTVGGPEVSDGAPPGSESKPPGEQPPLETQTAEPQAPESAPPSGPAQPPKANEHSRSGRRKGRRFGR